MSFITELKHRNVIIALLVFAVIFLVIDNYVFVADKEDRSEKSELRSEISRAGNKQQYITEIVDAVNELRKNK